MAAAIDSNTRVVFIANPNNPTGTWFNQAALNAFLAKVPENVLVVLDGIIIPNSQLNDIDPKDIESMSVLKDKSATELYGEKGKNGVIIITSKK